MQPYCPTPQPRQSANSRVEGHRPGRSRHKSCLAAHCGLQPHPRRGSVTAPPRSPCRFATVGPRRVPAGQVNAGKRSRQEHQTVDLPPLGGPGRHPVNSTVQAVSEALKIVGADLGLRNQLSNHRNKRVPRPKMKALEGVCSLARPTTSRCCFSKSPRYHTPAGQWEGG